MRTLIIADLHITEDSISEIDNIFTKDILSIQADRVIQLGDFYDRNRPSPAELKYGTSLVDSLVKKYKDVTILAGNGSHEFLNNTAVVEYLNNLGVKIIKEDHVVIDDIFYGHFMLYESDLQYGSGKCGIKDLEKYKYAFLGHQHNIQKLSNTIYHLGSIRYVNWNEVTDDFKQVAIIEDDKLEFIPLKKPIKMNDVHSIEELQDVEFDSKVRLVINSFEQFKKEINLLSNYKKKFIEFKVKLNFEKDLEVSKEVKSNKKLEDIIEAGIAQIKDKEVRKLLQESLNG